MPQAFTGSRSVSSYYASALADVKTTLAAEDPFWLLKWDAEQLARHYADAWELKPIVDDPDRSPTSDTAIVGDRAFAVVALPIAGHRHNAAALQLRAAAWPPEPEIERRAYFLPDQQTIEIRAEPPHAKHMLAVVRALIAELNADIEEQTPAFKAGVEELVRSRQADLAGVLAASARELAGLGFPPPVPDPGGEQPRPVLPDGQVVTMNTAVVRPKLFVGSSSEGKHVAEYLQLGLDDVADVTVWTQGVFGPSSSNLQNLVRRTRETDFAVLVLTPDDLATKRGATGFAPRDNVIFELGLFMGALGTDRAFMVQDRSCALLLPTDLAGIGRLTYRTRNDGNWSAAVGPVCTELKSAMGILP